MFKNKVNLSTQDHDQEMNIMLTVYNEHKAFDEELLKPPSGCVEMFGNYVTCITVANTSESNHAK